MCKLAVQPGRLPPAVGVAPWPEGDTINPVFEEHIRNLDNWAMGSEFGKRFPELMDAIRAGTG